MLDRNTWNRSTVQKLVIYQAFCLDVARDRTNETSNDN